MRCTGRAAVLIAALVGGCNSDPAQTCEPSRGYCAIPGCACESDINAVHPFPEEVGHWAAGEIPLPEGVGTFEVYGLRYAVRMGGMGFEVCEFSPHRAQLFTSGSSTPPATPTVLWESENVMADGEQTSQLVAFSQVVSPPIRVLDSESLFVSVQMNGTAEGVLCLDACGQQPPDVARRSWWSNAVDAPYPWTSLADFDIPFAYDVEVIGAPLDER